MPWLLPVAGAVLLAAAVAFLDLPYVSPLLRFTLVGALVLGLLWGGWRILRVFLWRVGRRLAFSYFLIGVLPIPMVALLLLVWGYLLAGFFLGHLYRDGVRSLQSEVEAQAAARLEELEHAGRPPREDEPSLAYGDYRGGRRVAGDPRAPAVWPAWLEARKGAEDERNGEALTPFFARDDGSPVLAAAVARGDRGVVALFVGDLEQALSERTDVWVELVRPGEPGAKPAFYFELGSRRIPVQVMRREGSAVEAEKFFKRRSEGERFWDSPGLWWGDVSGQIVRGSGAARAAGTAPAAAAGTTRPVQEPLQVTLRATPRILLRHLFAASAELDTGAWGALVALAFLLFDVYLVAVGMAVFMIFGLSRAVNRLYRATAAVQQGDFSVRIPVRRRDQVGDLQRSFNQMAANLERLVATAAQKEVLEKELSIARDLQKSLLPGDIPSGKAVEFATLFQPSAAIGGDYFDILRLDERRLAVFIADVSGHGLSSGLRMAMLKAALLILVKEKTDASAILRRLDEVVRAEADRRTFVTATLAVLDLVLGTLEITNAGHPPTYLVRGETVQEILLPGSPLGGLGTNYGHRTVTLTRGDVVVWLSDGLIEAASPEGEPFSYEAVVQALSAGGDSAGAVRDRLLAAVERHTVGHPQGDDRTLVVMQYRGAAQAAMAPAAGG
jgi:serine phosphatase RsbU (regulator of sigma subunit)